MKCSALLWAIAAMIVCGCARSRSTAQAAATSDYYAVKTASAAFYIYGPQQANGPDRKLPRDTLLTISKKSLGYARVRLTSGQEGYVAMDDIRPAPASVIAKAMPSPTPAAAPAKLNYPEPNLPPVESTPAVEPTAIAAPSP